MHTWKTLTLASAFPIAVFLSACGSGNDGSGPTTGTETTAVSAYLTDDLAGYQSVEFTLNSVQLRHTGQGIAAVRSIQPCRPAGSDRHQA